MAIGKNDFHVTPCPLSINDPGINSLSAAGSGITAQFSELLSSKAEVDLPFVCLGEWPQRFRPGVPFDAVQRNHVLNTAVGLRFGFTGFCLERRTTSFPLDEADK
jgi:hypothetical protein